MPRGETETRHRVVAEREQLVWQITRPKKRIESVLHANLIPPYKGILFSQRGRTWLTAQPHREDQRRGTFAMPEKSTALALSSLKWTSAPPERPIERARHSPRMTITGVNTTLHDRLAAWATSALLVAGKARELLRNSTSGPAIWRQTGRSRSHHETRSAHAPSMLVEAAWVMSRAPGQLVNFVRIRDKRGKHVDDVATARKLAVVVWHMHDQGRGPPGADRRSAAETSETRTKAGDAYRRGGHRKDR